MVAPKGHPWYGGGRKKKVIPTPETVITESTQKYVDMTTDVLLSLLKSNYQKIDDSDIEIRNALWMRAELSWLLRPIQLQIYNAIKQAIVRKESLKYVLNCSRRIGKSFVLCLIAIECAIKSGEHPILFAAPTQKSLKKIVRPLFRQILKTVPGELRPRYKTLDGAYVFKHNNAEINIAGCNGEHGDDLRGTSAAICLIDEAGMIDDLEYLVEDIAMPQLLTTNGNLIMASTPPRTPAHPFVEYVQAASLIGNYSKFDIYQSGYPIELIERFCKEAGGKDSTTWRREYLCEFVVDSNYAIIPEWKVEYVQVYPRDEFWQYYATYEAMDIGGSDKNATLFAWYDFKKAKIIIEDEVVIDRPVMTSLKIATDIRQKEKALWDNKEVKHRVADNNNIILLQDLGQLHGIHFAPVVKDNLEAMVNQLRLWVEQGKVIVNPRCLQTIGCLKYGIWTERRDKFDKNKSYGHFDALAALIYLVRTIDIYTNPIPQYLGMHDNLHMIVGKEKQSLEGEAVLKMFNLLGNRH